MTGKPTRGLFVTGTDTDVGKTYVASAIARTLFLAGRRVGVYKPAASGCPVRDGRRYAEDAERLWEAAGRPESLGQVCPQAFAAPLAPHLAARAEGRAIDEPLLAGGLAAWQDYEIVLVEGAGGLLSPLSDCLCVADLAARIGFPLVIVALNRVGVINQVLQTVLTAKVYEPGIPLAGVILNDGPENPKDPSRDSNLAEIQSRCGPPVLAHVSQASPSAIANVDWWSLAGRAG